MPENPITPIAPTTHVESPTIFQVFLINWWDAIRPTTSNLHSD
jgi:hypothetical protein